VIRRKKELWPELNQWTAFLEMLWLKKGLSHKETKKRSKQWQLDIQKQLLDAVLEDAESSK
jgi:hypothetical protein